MANDNFARGLIPNPGAGRKVVQGHYYLASTGAQFFLGFPVTEAADGRVVPTTINTAAQMILGAVMGVLTGNPGRGAPTDVPYASSGGTTDRFVLVADDPDQEFILQENTGGAALTPASAFETFSLIFEAGSGNDSSGYTTLEIDRTTSVLTGSGAVQLMRIHDIVNSDGTQNAAGNYAKWIVRITNHARRGQPLANPAL